MVHIVFGVSAAATLKHILYKLDKKEKEPVITIEDCFSIGPIWNLHKNSGREERLLWVKSNNIFGREDLLDYKEYNDRALNQIKHILEGECVVVWNCENASEQTGLRYVMYLLKNRKKKTIVINLTKLNTFLFGSDIRSGTVLSSGEVMPERMQIIYEKIEECTCLTMEEEKGLVMDWLTLSKSKESMRVWKNGKIDCVPEDFYDKFIIQRAKKIQNQEKSALYIKSAFLIGDVLGRLDQYFISEFLEYRLRTLIKKDIFEVKGDLKAMRYYSVRLKSS